MDKILYGTCCNFAYSCLTKLNIKEYRSQDIVNEFFFENEVTFDNYKKLVFEVIKKLQLKPLSRYETEYVPKVNHVKEQQHQCGTCGQIKPIDYFYIHRFKPLKNCKDCMTTKQRECYKTKSSYRLLRKRKIMISEIDEMIELLQKRRSEILQIVNT